MASNYGWIWSGMLPLLLATMLPAPASAAGSHTEELAAIDYQLDSVEDRMSKLSLDFTQRRGLIGAAEARQRYEDAVYAFLVGEHEDAAMTFFALVESEALVSEALAQDSEWYLAECLFEMGNYATALDAYEHVAEQGNRHPFFADAVIRVLEIYGLQKDFDKVQAMYREYFTDPTQRNYIEPNALIKYTIGKVYYRKGAEGFARAKGIFSEVLPSSSYYSRARYFMGTILVTQGDFEAAKREFRLAADAEALTSRTEEVKELSWLALGRLHYETGDYTQAIEHYQKLDSSSAYFVDQLYEMAWTYIKQENWSEALRAIDIFLFAYPDHRYTMQLQITEGHLYMKDQGYERALGSYETVVEQYTPILDRLADLESDRGSAEQIFAQMSEEDVFTSNLDLPAFAVEMLVEGEQVSRAVGATEELSRQRQDIVLTQGLIVEVEAALSGTVESIGTFNRGRLGIQQVRERSLGLRSELIGAELDYLLDNAPDTYRPELRELKDRYLLLGSTTEDLQGAESEGADRYDIHLEQVRAVQGRAFQIQQVNADLRAEATAIRNQLSNAQLSPEDTEYTRSRMAQVQEWLEASEQRLAFIQSEALRSQVMRSVPKLGADENSEQWSLLARDFDELQRLLNTYWQRTQTPERDALFGQVTDLWARMVAVEQLATTTRGRLDATEGQEMALLRQRLSEERSIVGVTSSVLENTSTDAEGLAARITQDEFGRLKDQFADTIMRADVGIVDVYWIRKTAVSDEAMRLRQEQADRLDDLDRRFQVLNQKLEN
jgi:tetratricopeptide (TPR) repeat protein